MENIITITIPPAIQESLIDWLLEVHGRTGFTSFPVSGHSSRPDGLSLAEQVSGQRRHVRFQIHIPDAETDAFLLRLRADFSGAGLHYWVSPVLDSGHI